MKQVINISKQLINVCLYLIDFQYMGVWYQAHWYPREKRPAGENFLAQFVEDPVDDDLVYYNYFFTSVFLTY